MSSRLDLMTLDLFVAVVEERSLAKASERKRIAISAVSRRIADLEQAFDVRLLHRRHNGVEPTPAGLALLAHARGLLRGTHQLEDELRGYATGSQGLIRIHATESAVFGRLPDVLKTFVDAHPLVRIEFQEATSPRVVRAVIENVADIGIYVGDLPTEGLEWFPFHADRLIVVLPRGHRLAARRSVRFAELLDEDFIGQEADSATDLLMRAAARQLGRTPRSRIRVGGFDAACRMVEAGLGIALTAERITAKLAPVMHLHQVELDEAWAVRPHLVCVRDVGALPAAARSLLDHLTGCDPADGALPIARMIAAD